MSHVLFIGTLRDGPAGHLRHFTGASLRWLIGSTQPHATRSGHWESIQMVVERVYVKYAMCKLLPMLKGYSEVFGTWTNVLKMSPSKRCHKTSINGLCTEARTEARRWMVFCWSSRLIRSTGRYLKHNMKYQRIQHNNI